MSTGAAIADSHAPEVPPQDDAGLKLVLGLAVGVCIGGGLWALLIGLAIVGGEG